MNQDKEEMKQAEDLIASEMNKLSMKEISKALDDVHCVCEDLNEDDEMVERLLADFDERIKAQCNPTYELAASQDRTYVEDKAFRLKFLRANLYDVKRSIRNLMIFLQYKATYFGPDKVGRDIELSDLNQEDLDLLTSGLFHMHEESGRIVLYMLSNLLCRIKESTMVSTFIVAIFNSTAFMGSLLICFQLIVEVLRTTFTTIYKYPCQECR